MHHKAHRSLRQIAHPYLFVLKEGGKIMQNPLDYSLMMLLLQSNEKILSPHEKKRIVLKQKK